MTDIPEDIMKAAEDALDKMLCHCVEASGSSEAYRLDSVKEIARALMAERERMASLLRDPAAVRVNYLRGDIACQALIDEAVMAERERCAKVVETMKVCEIGDRLMLASSIRKGDEE